ncbi:MAG: ClpXP protease specificity-enhancing factor [Betaproteobacteria bacterium]|nr:ClpXP protease specificity-enhancing factor [Betaproteobacteria bacterium]
MSELSTRPYFIRAIYEWCADSGLTPYLAIKVGKHTRVPMEFVKDGQIILNISPVSARNLTLGNDLIRFSARFGGVARDIEIPVGSVISIYARENAQGLSFPEQEGEEGVPDETISSDAGSTLLPDGEPPAPRGKPQLKIIK